MNEEPLIEPTPVSPPDVADWVAEYVGQDEPKAEYISRTWTGPDHSLVFVLFEDRRFCGSGGCTMFVLKPEGSGFKRMGRMTLVRPPVRVLSTFTYGQPDLGIQVAGGGLVEPYEALVPFDGRSYASNPTVEPAHETHGAMGETVIGPDDVPAA